MYAEREEVHDALLDVWYVGVAYGDFGAVIGKLFYPKRYIAHHVVVAALTVALIYTVGVVFLACAVDGDADAEVCVVLLNEALHLWLVVVDAVGGDIESVGVEPWVVATEHLGLDVVACLVNKVYLQERLAADELEHHRRVFLHHAFVRQYKIHRLFGGFQSHALAVVLTHLVAVATSQLAVFGYDKGDALGPPFFPLPFNGHWGELEFHIRQYGIQVQHD